VLWVENAQRDHADFVNKLRTRGVDVVELHDLLAQTLAIPEAKSWILGRSLPMRLGSASSKTPVLFSNHSATVSSPNS
jgi:arginine deiminase